MKEAACTTVWTILALPQLPWTYFPPCRFFSSAAPRSSPFYPQASGPDVSRSYVSLIVVSNSLVDTRGAPQESPFVRSSLVPAPSNGPVFSSFFFPHRRSATPLRRTPCAGHSPDVHNRFSGVVPLFFAKGFCRAVQFFSCQSSCVGVYVPHFLL